MERLTQCLTLGVLGQSSSKKDRISGVAISLIQFWGQFCTGKLCCQCVDHCILTAWPSGLSSGAGLGFQPSCAALFLSGAPPAPVSPEPPPLLRSKQQQAVPVAGLALGAGRLIRR